MEEPKKTLADRIREKAPTFGSPHDDQKKEQSKTLKNKEAPEGPAKSLGDRMNEGATHFGSPHDDQKRESAMKHKNDVPKAMTAADRERVRKEQNKDRNNGPGGF
jgi:hypothetical protein